MNILLCNDDGYGAPGIESLANALRCTHEVWIIAPKSNKSGAGCSMNLGKKLEINNIKQNEYSLDGTPVDCIMAGFKGSFLPGKPDLVISGINRGGNLGSDVIYSGTCGAAIQAALYGVPAIALSVEFNEGDIDFDPLAKFVANNFDSIIKLAESEIVNVGGIALKHFLNINALSLKEYKGLKQASSSERLYGDELVILEENGKQYTSLIPCDTIISKGDTQNDVKIIKEGYVSYSKIYTIPASLE